uniref:WAPL cohesin release factor b n=1 Tax=Astyanax mexicanus TaxID=7994 RepID=A0A8B9K8M6_ASTMX
MTSRFGKTYSRKAGGDGSSKFDEVLSNKRATLSTKWGETTYKAQLGSKRPGLKVDQADRNKRPKLVKDDGSEDPFGFDSDEESKPVTSRSVAQPKASSVRPAATDAPKASLTLEPNSRVSQPASIEAVAPSWMSPSLSTDRSAHRVPEDAGRFFSSSTAGKTYNWSSESTDRHSYSWYKNASESDRRPLAQTTTLKSEKSEDKDSFDAWSAVVGLGAHSTSPLTVSRDLPSSTWTAGGYGHSSSSSFQTKPPVETYIEDVGQGDSDVPVEPSQSEDPSKSLLRASNCRTYCRSNKGKQSGGADGFGSAFDSISSGRPRDYTVLHPSSVSACNVTIQDSIDRGMEEFSSSASSSDLGDAGRLRKKVETETKPVRFRPTQNKSKKDSKLELFGFDDGEAFAEDDDPVSSGRSNYKIKYFGFDDLSESDSDEDESTAERRRAKRKAMAAAVLEETSIDRPQPTSSLESQSSTGQRLGLKRGPLEAPEATSRSMSEALKKPQEKAKEGGRKIFSGPKRVSPSTSLYAHAGPSGSSKESNSHKGDEAVFKTPPLPPKVIKSVTIPTQPYQDIVTALKCRKEHKELYTVVQHVKHFNDVVEFGENQEFTDDFEYLATGLKSGQPLNTRCLSIISLATRCALPSFRMHLRARGKVAQVFKTINDAPQHSNLALCTASLMYILSRDRLNMDLDRASLELMIRLLELDQDTSTDNQLSSKEMNKVKEKIRKLCETVHNKHLDLENITVVTKTGEQEDLIITALNCVLKVPQYLPQEQRFDIRVLGLGLLINLVEYSARNRHCLVEMEMDGGEVWSSMCVSDKEELNTEGSNSAIAALVKLFLQREHAARLAETETDDFINDVPKAPLDQSGEWHESSSGEIQWVASENNPTEDQKDKKKEEEDEELDLNKALQHAGKHMEDSIVASYTALLLGCLCQGSPMNVMFYMQHCFVVPTSSCGGSWVFSVMFHLLVFSSLAV